MNIRGERVTLRAIEPEDLPLLARWSNDPDIQSMLGGWHWPSSLLTMRDWLERIRSDTLNQRFAIDTDEGLVGTANLVEINWKDRNATHGMLIGDTANRGRGYGFDTVRAVMRYAFEELGLERLDTTIIEYNEPSLRLYVGKCGWKEEGRQRRWYFRRGRHWDRLLVGITREDYAAWASGREAGR